MNPKTHEMVDLRRVSPHVREGDLPTGGTYLLLVSALRSGNYTVSVRTGNAQVGAPALRIATLAKSSAPPREGAQWKPLRGDSLVTYDADVRSARRDGAANFVWIRGTMAKEMPGGDGTTGPWNRALFLVGVDCAASRVMSLAVRMYSRSGAEVASEIIAEPQWLPFGHEAAALDPETLRMTCTATSGR
jgi:hypothetical protein